MDGGHARTPGLDVLRMRLQPPCAYQGGKRRQAPEIVRHMGSLVGKRTPFYDLCCGSGAVSLELISHGHDPSTITMVDIGPWGDLWSLVGRGMFDVDRLRSYLLELPSDDVQIPDFMYELRDATSPGQEGASYVFLLLQAASFGGLAVGVREDGTWNARSLARRKEGDGRYAFYPRPNVLLRRMEMICKHAKGVRGFRMNALTVVPEQGSVVYIDPPYSESVNEYRQHMDAHSFASKFPQHPVFVSEMRPLNASAREVCSRKKGAFTGREKADKREYLSLFNSGWTNPETVADRVEQTNLFS